jgi:hypothetical protein
VLTWTRRVYSLLLLANSLPETTAQPLAQVVGTRAISRVNLRPTSSWWRLSVCYCNCLAGLWTISCTCIGHFSLQCCPSGWKAGGWSLKVISDAVCMSHGRATKHRDLLSRACGQIKIRVYNTPPVKMAIPDLPRRNSRTLTTSP